ncbi:folD [Symbiodinium microadriaticum]|nr:folD [Symbiodinium microadriaticum]
MIRRINFFAGPGAGKSTVAARIFSELKIRGFDVEHIPEYIKTWAHENRKPESYDQLYVFAKQLKAEDVILRNVKHIVTDSPLLLNTSYSKLYNFQASDHLIRIAQQFDRDFPPLNLYIERTVDYVDKGRYQSYEQAVDFDNFLLEFLDENLEGELLKILDGTKISKEIRGEIEDEILCRRPPCLAVVLCTEDPASEIYVKRKQKACEEVGITTFLIRPFQGGIEKWDHPAEHLLSTIDYLNDDPAIHGILVQLPLPNNIPQHWVFDRINPLKDVDVFSPTNVGLLLQGRPRLIPCTPQGIQELLIRSGIPIAGKKVAIINRSDIVGKPLNALLIQDDGNRANATVFLCHDRTPPDRLKDVCLSADIIVVAVGIPNFLTEDMVHDKSVIVDVGINRKEGSKKIVGDVHPAVHEKVYAYSPVPGGVGPMTVTILTELMMTEQRFITMAEAESMVTEAVAKVRIGLARAPRPFKVFGLGNSNKYATRVCEQLGGIKLTKHTEKTFDDGEVYLKSGPEHNDAEEGNVRGHNVFVIQSLYSDNNESVNDKLVKLCFMCGSLKDASAHEVTPIIPHLGYARQDRKTESRAPISTKYVARMLESVGIDRVLMFDCHNLSAEQNAFSVPIDNLEAKRLFAKWVAQTLYDIRGEVKKIRVLTPDSGGLNRCTRFRNTLVDELRALGSEELADDIEVVIYDKVRIKGVVHGGRIIGDVDGAHVVAYDDMISTGGTMRKACKAAIEANAWLHAICATHGLFVGNANEVFDGLDTKIVVTDTVDPFRLNEPNRDKLEIISTTEMVASAIMRIHSGTGSISDRHHSTDWENPTMTTATVSTESLQQIGELKERAEELTATYQAEFGEIMQQISAIATGEQVAATSAPATAPTATSPAPKRGGGKKTASTPSSKKKTTGKKSSGPVKPENRNYDNDMSLKEAVFDVLDRENWKGILDKEDGDVALSAGEVKKVIETEQKWVSSAADITSQLQGALRDLRKMNLVVWENKKYYVPEGAEYPKS